MSLEEYYQSLKDRESEFTAECAQGYEAVLWDIEEILGLEHGQ